MMELNPLSHSAAKLSPCFRAELLEVLESWSCEESRVGNFSSRVVSEVKAVERVTSCPPSTSFVLWMLVGIESPLEVWLEYSEVCRVVLCPFQSLRSLFFFSFLSLAKMMRSETAGVGGMVVMMVLVVSTDSVLFVSIRFCCLRVQCSCKH